tara:strand:- start:174 stop:347 length:174 start_codon:yes stop_codon:yes gene_type:complete
MRAVTHLMLLTIINDNNKDPFEFMTGIITGTSLIAVLGGLANYIVPKYRKSKVYLIK